MEKQFGAYLKKLRLDRNLSLRDVEKLTKISNPYISQIERGERGIPNFSIIKRLAETYGVTATEIFRNAEKEADIPAPNINFISRNYEKLSEDKKTALKHFLRHLVKQEEEDKKEGD